MIANPRQGSFIKSSTSTSRSGHGITTTTTPDISITQGEAMTEAIGKPIMGRDRLAGATKVFIERDRLKEQNDAMWQRNTELLEENRELKAEIKRLKREIIGCC